MKSKEQDHADNLPKNSRPSELRHWRSESTPARTGQFVACHHHQFVLADRSQMSPSYISN